MAQLFMLSYPQPISSLYPEGIDCNRNEENIREPLPLYEMLNKYKNEARHSRIVSHNRVIIAHVVHKATTC